jgi:hypothetical protein
LTQLVAEGWCRSQFRGHPLNSTGIKAAVADQRSDSGIYDDFRGVPVVGVYRWLPEVQAALLVEQDLSEAFRVILTTLSLLST